VLFQHATRAETATVLAASRNFYGTLKVYDHFVDEPDQHYRLLMHGATTHGLQFTAPDRAMQPSTYYGPTSGVGLAVKHLDRPAGMKVGIVGLGTGTIAAYGRAGDTYRFYEINPAVERLARAPFTYLAQTPAKVDVIMGDARLELEHELDRKEPQNFDLLALDAFSSDAIPVHLLTAEALALYLRHLKPDGVIAIHISNRYLDLQPVVERLADHHGLAVACISDDPTDDWWQYSTTWMLLTKSLPFLAKSEILGVTEAPPPDRRPAPLWTDDQANLYSILK
jgi:SAM-dependent methyltransferase